MLHYTHIACLVIYITTDSPCLTLARTTLVRFKFVLPRVDIVATSRWWYFQGQTMGYFN